MEPYLIFEYSVGDEFIDRNLVYYDHATKLLIGESQIISNGDRLSLQNQSYPTIQAALQKILLYMPPIYQSDFFMDICDTDPIVQNIGKFQLPEHSAYKYEWLALFCIDDTIHYQSHTPLYNTHKSQIQNTIENMLQALIEF